MPKKKMKNLSLENSPATLYFSWHYKVARSKLGLSFFPHKIISWDLSNNQDIVHSFKLLLVKAVAVDLWFTPAIESPRITYRALAAHP